jgi:hypothetical protein
LKNKKSISFGKTKSNYLTERRICSWNSLSQLRA